MQNSVALPTSEKKVVNELTNNWVCPEFKVSGVFSSHMVIQRECPVRVWGFSTNVGGKVRGEFMGEGAVATVSESGEWELTFSSHLYTWEPQTMIIYDEQGHREVFEDILLGDVWFIGGQSNAELTLAPCMALTPSVTFAESDNFRLFTQTQAYVYTHQEFCNHPQPDIINSEWRWKLPGEAASLEFSAMGWYFASEVTKKSPIPLGMVMMCAGGACIRELLPEDVAHSIGYTYGANVRESGYYNTLIHPFLKLAFKGMLFFQGESEGGDKNLAEIYNLELALLVADERARFGRSFPFYNVQISDYREEGSQFFPWHDIVRVRQFDALSEIPNSTLSVSMDLGAPMEFEDWAHSLRKLEVGERLAALVLAREYGVGKESEVSSPMPDSARIVPDKGQIIIDFTNVGSGLTALGHSPVDSLEQEVEGFSIGDYDHRTPAKAHITGRCYVTVDIPEGMSEEEITHVNYAFSLRVTPDNATLRGGNNLPCPAFSLKL